MLAFDALLLSQGCGPGNLFALCSLDRWVKICHQIFLLREPRKINITLVFDIYEFLRWPKALCFARKILDF